MLTIFANISLLITVALVPVILIIVFGPILQKAGYAKWWALLFAIPMINLISIWLFAFRRWPADPQG